MTSFFKTASLASVGTTSRYPPDGMSLVLGRKDRGRRRFVRRLQLSGPWTRREAKRAPIYWELAVNEPEGLIRRHRAAEKVDRASGDLASPRRIPEATTE
jgi:hypothetical protein